MFGVVDAMEDGTERAGGRVLKCSLVRRTLRTQQHFTWHYLGFILVGVRCDAFQIMEHENFKPFSAQ